MTDVWDRRPGTDTGAVGVGGLRRLDDLGVKVHTLKHLKLYEGVLLADGVAAIVGSISCATGSLDESASFTERIRIADDYLLLRAAAQRSPGAT